MKIHWHNIIFLILGIALLVLLTRGSSSLGVAIGAMAHIGSGSTVEEKTLGLIVLGLICVLIVAIVKILTRNRDR